jgi:hypothetical protein
MIVNHSFALTNDRIARLGSAGVHSLKDLAGVLAALDLRAVVQIEELVVRSKTPVVQNEERP